MKPLTIVCSLTIGLTILSLTPILATAQTRTPTSGGVTRSNQNINRGFPDNYDHLRQNRGYYQESYPLYNSYPFYPSPIPEPSATYIYGSPIPTPMPVNPYTGHASDGNLYQDRFIHNRHHRYQQVDPYPYPYPSYPYSYPYYSYPYYPYYPNNNGSYIYYGSDDGITIHVNP